MDHHPVQTNQTDEGRNVHASGRASARWLRRATAVGLVVGVLSVFAGATPASAQSVVGGGGSGWSIQTNPTTSVTANCHNLSRQIGTYVGAFPDAGWNAQWVYIEVVLTEHSTGRRWISRSPVLASYANQAATFTPSFSVSRQALGSFGIHATVQRWNGAAWSAAWPVNAQHTMNYNHNIWLHGSRVGSCLFYPM